MKNILNIDQKTIIQFAAPVVIAVAFISFGAYKVFAQPSNTNNTNTTTITDNKNIEDPSKSELVTAQNPQSPVQLKMATELSDVVAFASGATRLGPKGREKIKEVWQSVDPQKHQLFLYGYTGALKDKQRMTDLARQRAISTKLYIVKEFDANPKDITVVEPKFYLHKGALPENPKQVKTVVRDKNS